MTARSAGCEVRTMFIVYLAMIFLGLSLMLGVALRHVP
jgi:hypothetical protein